jgi:lipopolysaccharide transport system ATP-binding protein
MSDIAICVQDISKHYRIGERERYKMLREVLTRWISAQFRTTTSRFIGGNAPPGGRLSSNQFWALKHISFEVRQGEVLGIIGNNGAGKSTLLKILSRITLPTKGRAEVNGRLGSLLEVGTGFHPELTGRENIFLNGAILGMKRVEVESKFDEIVSFAEVEKFIDTPVKQYSSGMYLRLAFAVAAHLEPEILLVDEVLAVGDRGFQKKCLGKMGEVAKEGRTVLFVSHNLQAISQLTGRCLLLNDGELIFDGPTNQALQQYRAVETGIRSLGSYRAISVIPYNHLSWATVQTSLCHGLHRWGEPITFEFGLEITQPMDGLCFSFYVVDEHAKQVCHFWMFNSDVIRTRERRTFVLRCQVPKFRLYMGSYTITTWVSERRGDTDFESLTGICPFEVTMDGIHRDQYDWKAGDCIYLEDAEWEVRQDAAVG